MATVCQLFMRLYCGIYMQFNSIVRRRSVGQIHNINSNGVCKIAKMCLEIFCLLYQCARNGHEKFQSDFCL